MWQPTEALRREHPLRDAPVASIVVPAHNEERVVGRLLAAVLDAADPGEFDVYVICNGCTDRTADVARSVGGVTVIELQEASKAAALEASRDHVRCWPAVYVDADVVIDTASLRLLVERLAAADGVLVAGPQRVLEDDGLSWPLRQYYRVWERLPAVRTGLFGRGVVAVAARGYNRIAALPRVIADDVAFTAAFAPEERVVVPEARVRIWPARTWGALLRRRVRAVQGMNQVRGVAEVDAPPPTGLRDLAGVVRSDSSLLPGLVIFVMVTLAARARERWRRRRGSAEWLRDDSSRSD